MSLISAVYQGLTVAVSPFVALGFLFSARGRIRVLERFGAPSLPSCDYERWWHAASLGEVQALIPILKLTAKRQLLTVTSPSALGASLPHNVDVRIAPFDSINFYQRLFQNARFESLVVSETELWPGMLEFAAIRRTKIFWINMRLRSASLAWYKRLRFWFEPLLGSATVFAGSAADKMRWIQVFPSLRPPLLLGNSKFDRTPTITSLDQMRLVFLRFFLNPKRLLVLGSIHVPELEILLPALAQLGVLIPELQVIIAPRHRERDVEIARLLESHKFRFDRRSSMRGASQERIVLLDTFGELESCYSCADVAFIGGSLLPLGGHNPLEAAQYGCAVLMGPHNEVVQGICAELSEQGALKIITKSEEFISEVQRVVTDKSVREKIGLAATSVAARHRGASLRLYQALCAASSAGNGADESEIVNVS